jgi:uncharacterized protein
MANNLSTVQQIYACFGQGDVPGILAQLADNVTFFNGADPAVAPFGGTFRGKEGVTQFFVALGSTLETTYFEPTNFQASGDRVTNDVRHDGIARSTGKAFSVSIPFVWTFNEQGQVTNWDGSGDYSSVNAALS